MRRTIMFLAARNNYLCTLTWATVVAFCADMAAHPYWIGLG